MRSLVKSALSVIVIFLLWMTPAAADDVLGDINNDDRIDLQEAVYSLQVTAGVRTATTLPELNPIERDISLAGSGMTMIGMRAQDFHPVTMENNMGVNGSDILTVRYILPQENECGCGDDPDPNDSVSISCDQLPELTLKGDMPLTSSVGYVNEDLTVAPYSLWGGECYCAGHISNNANSASALLILISSPPGFEPAYKEVLYLTSIIQSAGKFQNRPFTADQIANTNIKGFRANSIISAFKQCPLTIRFYLTEDGKLMREDVSAGTNAVMLESGLKDLQFVFGLDKNKDGAVDDWLGDDDSDLFTNGDVPDDDRPLIRDIRILKTFATQIGTP